MLAEEGWQDRRVAFEGPSMPAEMALATSLSSQGQAVPPCSGSAPTAGLGAPPSKMDFFCKLGYGKQDVCKVLQSLGQEALEDDVLKELIRMGSKPQAPESWAQPAPLRLVPRGSGSASDVPPWLHEDGDSSSHLRPIVIDGSNVAMSHGNKEVFSCWGIRLAVDWFRQRGHTYVKVFVPSWRKEPPRQDSPIADQHILAELEKQSVLVYTPSRKVKGKRVVCYDDRYIVKVAYEKDGVIVSNDHYRDLQNENPEWKWFIEQRLLMYSFVSNRFMPPDDPLGRHGPTLNNFLSKKPLPPEPKWQPCPYGKKCTYGNKCKFYHPERPHHGQLPVADELRAKIQVSFGLGNEEEPSRCGPAGETALLPCSRCAWCLAGSRREPALGAAAGAADARTERPRAQPAPGRRRQQQQQQEELPAALRALRLRAEPPRARGCPRGALRPPPPAAGPAMLPPPPPSPGAAAGPAMLPPPPPSPGAAAGPAVPPLPPPPLRRPPAAAAARALPLGTRGTW